MKFKEKIDELYYDALELNENIIRNNLQLITKNIKNRKKSLQMKNFWRTNAFKMKKAINKWHQSVQGKRFHRNLGNFLATHLTRNDLGLGLKRESLDLNTDINISIDSVSNALLGLNNIKTHLILELQYFERDLEALEEFLEIFFKFLDDAYKIEVELLKAYISGKINYEILLELLDIFIFFIDEKAFVYEVRQMNGLSNDKDETLKEDFELINNYENKYDKFIELLKKYKREEDE